MNRHIFCNNFLTSAQLAEDLLRNNLYHRWTTHFNWSDFPADLRPDEISLPRRITVSTQRRCCCDCLEGQKTSTFLSMQYEVQGQLFKCLQFLLFNSTTSTCGELRAEISNQMPQYYECSRQAKKWWRYLLWLCVNASVVNVHIPMLEADNFPNLLGYSFALNWSKCFQWFHIAETKRAGWRGPCESLASAYD